MKLFHVLLLMAVVYIMNVSCRVEPVVVEVPGILGKYGGYILGFIILLTAYLNSQDDNVVNFNLNGETMSASSGPTPTG